MKFISEYIQRLPEDFDSSRKTPILAYLESKEEELLPKRYEIYVRGDNYTLYLYDESNLDLLKTAVAEKDLFKKIEKKSTRGVMINESLGIVLKRDIGINREGWGEEERKRMKQFGPLSGNYALKELILMQSLRNLSKNRDGVLATYITDEGERRVEVPKPIGVIEEKEGRYYVEGYVPNTIPYRKKIRFPAMKLVETLSEVFEIPLDMEKIEKAHKRYEAGLIDSIYAEFINLIRSFNPINYTLRKIGIEHNESFEEYIASPTSDIVIDLEFAVIALPYDSGFEPVRSHFFQLTRIDKLIKDVAKSLSVGYRRPSFKERSEIFLRQLIGGLIYVLVYPFYLLNIQRENVYNILDNMYKWTREPWNKTNKRIWKRIEEIAERGDLLLQVEKLYEDKIYYIPLFQKKE